MDDKKKLELKILSDYIDKEQENLLRIESAIKSSEETLRVLSYRHKEISARINSLHEILQAAKGEF